MKTDERNREIVDLRKSGQTVKSIAERFGISGVRVRQIIEKQERKLRLEKAKLQKLNERKIEQNIYSYVPRDFIPEKVYSNDGGFISGRWDCGNPLCTYAFGHFSAYEAMQCAERIPSGEWADYCVKALTDIRLAESQLTE